jgi:hypothetical protein
MRNAFLKGRKQDDAARGDSRFLVVTIGKDSHILAGVTTVPPRRIVDQCVSSYRAAPLNCQISFEHPPSPTRLVLGPEASTVVCGVKR